MRLTSRVRSLLPYAFLPATYPAYRLRPAIRILMYHRVARLGRFDQLTVTPDRFDEQLATMASRCRVISLADAVTELELGAPRTPAVVVTFDDGYRDNLVNALPSLRRLGIPATIFVTARFTDGTLRHPRYPDEPGQLHLDWNDLGALSREPGISIGSHTLSHPHLTRLDDGAAAAEISDSRAEIAERIGRPVEFFCYPSGDLGERERRLVAAAGYRAAVSVRPGANHGLEDRFALRRTEVTDRDGARELALKLWGAFDPIHHVLHLRRERAFDKARRATP